MTAPTIQITLSAGKPPTEVRLFKAGVNHTLKGDFVWSKRSAELVRAQWVKLNRDFGFDWEHATFDESVKPQDREAAGWGKLDARPDGLFVVGISWTAEAGAKIAAKKFRYLSPTPQIDRKTGEIVGVLNCALTNSPATLSAAPLVLSSRPSPQHTRLNRMDNAMKSMYAACSALLAACQTGAESEDPSIKEMSTALSEVLAPAISKLQEMGANSDGEPASLSMLTAVYETAQKITGASEGVVGALMALSARDKQAKVQLAQKSERETLLSSIVKAKKHHPDALGELETFSVADLRSYLRDAPCVVPAAEEPAIPATRLSAQPSTPEEKVSPEVSADVDEIFAMARGRGE